VFASEREAFRAIAAEHWKIARPPDAPEPGAATAKARKAIEERLRLANVADTPGRHATMEDALAWARARVNLDLAPPRAVGPVTPLSLDDVNRLNRSLAKIPPAQTEMMRNERITLRYLPGDMGVGQEDDGPRGLTHDGRPWTSVQGVYQSARGSGGTAAFNAARMRLGDRITRGEISTTKQADDVALHEIGHAIDIRPTRRANLSESFDYQNALAGEGRDFMRRHGGRYVSDADANGIRESFAEGWMLWRYQPDRVRARAPRLAAFYERLDDWIATHGTLPDVRSGTYTRSVLTDPQADPGPSIFALTRDPNAVDNEWDVRAAFLADRFGGVSQP
jgi:hypothetical protein